MKKKEIIDYWVIAINNETDLRLIASVFPQINLDNGESIFSSLKGSVNKCFLIPNNGAWSILYDVQGYEVFFAKDFYENWYRILKERGALLAKAKHTKEEAEKLNKLTEEFNRFYIYKK